MHVYLVQPLSISRSQAPCRVPAVAHGLTDLRPSCLNAGFAFPESPEHQLQVIKKPSADIALVSRVDGIANIRV